MLLKNNIPLKDYSNYKIGGDAKYFLEVNSREDLVEGMGEWKNLGNDDPIFILGGGTNVLFPDEGFPGLVILDNLKGIETVGNEVKVMSGELFSDLVSFFEDHSFSGLEWAGGLPGTVGGGVRGNAGAFGGEVKDSVSRVLSINILDLTNKTRDNSEIAFSYRDSVYKSGEGKGEFIYEVYFKYELGNQEEIKKLTQEKREYRKDRHPLEFPNIGSTFKNIPVEKVSEKLISDLSLPIKDDPFPIIPVAKLLSLAGLKGRRVGDAQVSEKHPNFIVNLGHAKAADVLSLIKIIKNEIKEKYDIELEEEVIIL